MKYIIPLLFLLFWHHTFAQNGNSECYFSPIRADLNAEKASFPDYISGKLYQLAARLDSLFLLPETLLLPSGENQRYKIIFSSSEIIKKSAHGSFEYSPLGGYQTFCLSDSLEGQYITIPAPSRKETLSKGFMMPFIQCDTIIQFYHQDELIKITAHYSSSFCDETMSIPFCHINTQTSIFYCVREDRFEHFKKFKKP